MALKGLLAAAAALAITLAIVLPMPGARSEPAPSQIPTMEVGGR
ncbi:MAG TPA: hypothetical protein VEA44_01175 [Caulobacter sp.]|nr:hypothetical protein [Caulobacter sp.]